jgi:hypothetical protein
MIREEALKFVTEVPSSEFCVPFVQGMIDRMNMSYFKYGLVEEAYPNKVDAIGSLKQRLEKYADTGNLEYLMDAANFAMIEFMRPRHPKAYFKATDSDESPGRMGVEGKTIGATANTPGRENIRLGGSNKYTSGGFYKSEGD